MYFIVFPAVVLVIFEGANVAFGASSVVAYAVVDGVAMLLIWLCDVVVEVGLATLNSIFSKRVSSLNCSDRTVMVTDRAVVPEVVGVGKKTTKVPSSLFMEMKHGSTPSFLQL